jgi:hypothetical protein
MNDQDVEQMRRDAYEQLQHCQMELENALSMGNAKRVAQCRKWVAEARMHYKQAGGEQSLPKSTPLSKKNSLPSSPQSSEKPLYALPQAQLSRKLPKR